MADETKTIESLLGELNDEIRRQVVAERVTATEAGDTSNRAMSPAAVTAITGLLRDAIVIFNEFSITFAPSDRERLLSVGLRNRGFLEEAYAQAQANPSLIPSYMSMPEFKEAMENWEHKRPILTLLEQFIKTVSDSVLADSDSAIHDALDFYNFVKVAAHQRVPGAETVYNILKPYFIKRPNKPGATEDKPSERQLARDLRGLLSGTKEGKIVVENENPDRSGGHRHVVDAVHPAD